MWNLNRAEDGGVIAGALVVGVEVFLGKPTRVGLEDVIPKGNVHVQGRKVDRGVLLLVRTAEQSRTGPLDVVILVKPAKGADRHFTVAHSESVSGSKVRAKHGFSGVVVGSGFVKFPALNGVFSPIGFLPERCGKQGEVGCSQPIVPDPDHGQFALF